MNDSQPREEILVPLFALLATGFLFTHLHSQDTAGFFGALSLGIQEYHADG